MNYFIVTKRDDKPIDTITEIYPVDSLSEGIDRINSIISNKVNYFIINWSPKNINVNSISEYMKKISIEFSDGSTDYITIELISIMDNVKFLIE